MKLTIGMANYYNKYEVWSVVQALRLYQDLSDTEIIVIDNYGDSKLKSWCDGQPIVSYYLENSVVGTSYPRNKIFEHAKGEWTLVIDSHVFLLPNVIRDFKQWLDKNIRCIDLIHGPMLYDDLKSYVTHMNPSWGGHMWGTWADTIQEDKLGTEAFEIPMHGMGLFASRTDSWLRFVDGARGFGGEEGTIHEKYRKAGRKVFCLPCLKWNHYFKYSRGDQEQSPYPVHLEDKARNYVLGFQEIGLNTDVLIEQFGYRAESVINEVRSFTPSFSVVYYSDERNPKEVRNFCLEHLKNVLHSLNGELIISINKEGAPSHKRLYSQILSGLNRANSDWIFFAEDDVLYPEEHFMETPGLNTYGYNKNVWHLSNKGYFKNNWPGAFLSTLFGHKGAIKSAIQNKLKELAANKLVHAEPEQYEKCWQTTVPIIDVRHGGNFTGMREDSEYLNSLYGWDTSNILINKMQL